MKGRVVLVAGVGGGLGSAVVSLLGGAGATVVAVARSRETLDALDRHARARGWSYHPTQADLSRAGEAERVVESTISHHQRIDGVSLNAGRWIPGETVLHKMSDEEWSVGLHDNLEAVFRVSRAVIPAMMKQRNGSIVLVSATDRVRWSGNASYCVAKGGLMDLTAKLSHDYRPHGIRVNAVLPGAMPAVEPPDPPRDRSPLRLQNDPGVGSWEVARAIRYLLSEDGDWVTGALIRVDGGRSTWAEEEPART